MDAAKKKEIITNIIIVLCTLIIAFLMVRFELVKRAKREFNEGERYLSFYRNPDLKKQFYDEKLKKKEITETEYELLMEDNALKNAYVQYSTVTDLFTPPESKWVKLSRQRLSEITPEYNAWVDKLRKEIDDAPYTAPKK